MVYVDAIEVLSESDPRMQQSNLFTLSHRHDGFSYYSINVRESDSGDIAFVQDSLTRQGIPANIYPDRLGDYVICIRFSNKGELTTSKMEYHLLLKMIGEKELPGEDETNFCNQCLNVWDNQIRNGNVYSLSQFMKADKDE